MRDRPNSQIDFVAYDADGGVLLLGEAKSRPGTSEQWATGLRRNMLAHGILPSARFFFIATPERLYFWDQNPQQPQEGPPAFTLDAAKELKPYFDRLHRSPGPIAPEAFDLLVLSWLMDIVRTGEKRAGEDPSVRWLADSGLLASLQKARIVMHPAA